MEIICFLKYLNFASTLTKATSVFTPHSFSHPVSALCSISLLLPKKQHKKTVAHLQLLPQGCPTSKRLGMHTLWVTPGVNYTFPGHCGTVCPYSHTLHFVPTYAFCSPSATALCANVTPDSPSAPWAALPKPQRLNMAAGEGGAQSYCSPSSRGSGGEQGQPNLSWAAYNLWATS